MENEKSKDRKDKDHLKEEYTKLKQKFDLPDYELINKDFEIESINPEENVLREIVKEMHGTVDFYSRLLENLIQPDSKLCDMKEAGNLTKEEQTTIMDLYRRCMLINRTLLLVDLDYNEKEAATAINDTYKTWQEVKSELKPILIKMRDTWRGQAKKETYGGYYG
ncbi:MAG: hypothetical protein ACP5N2_00820 [Candidatus Nanoarchaeia archaeon]